uniref:Uncharacterized protein n=1 Tax=Arundo donax TaxID=35708 RepID=A0A0A9A419_ARUDO
MEYSGNPNLLGGIQFQLPLHVCEQYPLAGFGPAGLIGPWAGPWSMTRRYN